MWFNTGSEDGDSASKSNYSGVIGTVRLALAYPIAQYHTGLKEANAAATTENQQATLTTY